MNVRGRQRVVREMVRLRVSERSSLFGVSRGTAAPSLGLAAVSDQ
jgi:hypothetical protein